MGLLDSLLGLHSTKAQNSATIAANKGIQQAGSQNADLLTNYSDLGARYLNNATQNGWNDLQANTAQGADAIRQGSAGALSTLMGGRDAAVGTALGSNEAYVPYQASGGAALAMLGNALGLNGASGTATAQGTFQAGPGYRFSVDQATDEAARKAASLGMTASGNTLDAITRLSSNLANTEYGSWLDRLTGQQNVGLQANNAVSGNNATAAGFQYGAGSTGGQLQQQAGGLLASLFQNRGNQDARLNSNLGNALLNNSNLLGSNLASNNWKMAGGVAGNNLSNATAADAATNANNGLFSNMLSTLGSGFLTGTGSGKALSSAMMKF